MSSPHKVSWSQRVRRWLAGTLATLVIALAILVGLFRLLVPQISEYRDVIAHWAGEALGVPVEIAEIDVRWRWLVPEVVLEEVVLRPQAHDVDPLRADEIAIRVSPLDLLRPGPMRPGRVILRGGQFSVMREADGRIRIPGLGLFEPGEQVDSDERWRTVVAELLAKADYRVEASRLLVSDELLGIGPWLFAIDHVRLYSRGEQHRFRTALALPESLGGALDLDVRIQGPAKQPERWQWQALLDLQAKKLGVLSGLVDWDTLRPLEGGVAADLRITGEGLLPASLRGDLALQALESGVRGPAMRAIGDASGPRDIDLSGIDWQRERDGWYLVVADADFSLPGRSWPTSRLEVRQREQRLNGNLRYARIQDITALARELMAPDELVFSWLDRLRPEGEVRDLIGELSLSDGELKEYSLRGRLTGIGMRSWEQIPGFSGVNGWLRADSDGGRLDVDAGPVHFDYPDLFRERLSADRLQATLVWERDGDKWDIGAHNVRARNRDAQASAELSLAIHPGEPVWIRLEADVPEARSDNLSDYLPVGRMPDTAVEWLDNAVLGGVARNGRILVDGPTRPFPYENGEGRFSIQFDVEGGELDYEPGFPPVREASAHVRFAQAGMRVIGREAMVGTYRVQSALARIDNLQEPVLQLEGRANGRLSDGLDFLRESPLSEWFAAPLAPVRLDGPVLLDVSMHIPLESAADLRLDGRARLREAAGEVDWLPGRIDRLAGDLFFTEDGARSDELAGEHLGHPFRVVIDPGSRGRGAAPEAALQTVATLSGGVGVDQLKAALPDYGMLDWLDGEFQWQGEVRVPNEPGAGDIDVRLDSQLQGLAVDLPVPAGKTFDEARPFQARFSVGGDQSLVEAEYGGLMALALDVAVPAQAPARVRGVRVDVGQPRQPGVPAQGIAVHGQAEQLDTAAWLGVEWPGGDDDQDGALPLETLDIISDELLAGPVRLKEQSVRLDRQSDHWTLTLDGEDARGQLAIPLTVASDRSTVRGELERLNLRPISGEAGKPMLMSPLSVPSLDIRVLTLLREGLLLGSLDLLLLAEPDGLATERLQISGADIRGEFSAEWREEEASRQWGQLSGEIETDNVAAAMNSLGFLPGVDASFGKLDLDLSWIGPPGPAALESLSGQARMEMRSGQLQEVNPGAGRVFGLLSFSALPRRLYGDFRDVFGRGLRFDRIAGDFVLANGDAFTGNLRLEGPVANIELIGRTGLVSRDYDQRLRVDTQVGTALPVAGAIAGGVGVGAAMLLISELFREPLSRVGRLEYRIDGSWESPRVTPLDEEGRRVLDEGN